LKVEYLVPEHVKYPLDWLPKVLGDVAKIEIGGTPARNEPRYWAENGEGHTWVSIADLKHKWIVATEEQITSQGVAASNAKLVSKGTLLMSFKLTIGKVALAGIDLYTNEAIAAFLPKTTEIKTEWLYHALPEIAKGGTADQAVKGQTLNKAKLQSLGFRMPCANEQSSIAAILDTVDEAITSSEQLIRKLMQMKAGMLADLLTRGLDENGELRDPITQPEKFKDSPFGLIPTEWDTPTIGLMAVHIGSGVTPTGGSNVYKNEGIIFIRSQNVTFDGLLLEDIAYIDVRTHRNMKRSEVFPHDVLLNITGASIGRCCPLPEGIGSANVNQHVCAIRLPNGNVEDALLLSTLLASHIGQSQIHRLNAGGNREGLNYQQLGAFVIPWALRDERVRIAAVIASYDDRVATQKDELGKLKQLKKGIATDLLTGRVRVPIAGEGVQ
jgi:type I restriction enzyme, S subunit